LETRLKAGYVDPVSSVFADRRERNHFTAVGDRPDHGFLKVLGGRSLCWAGHSLRFGPLDFRQWPISYEEIAPYYSRAERLMEVYGDRDGLWNMPDGEFQKGVALRCGEQVLKRGVERLKQRGRVMEFVAQRKAIPTEASRARRTVCHYCGHCMNGCEVDAKYTSVNTPIALALLTGNLTLLTESTMTRIMMDGTGRKIAGIEYTDRQSATAKVEAKALVLACNSIETPRHLLINKTPEFPNGLANGSGQVGRNLISHFGLTVTGFFPELVKRDASNDDGTDYYHGLLTALYWDKPNPRFAGTYQVQCGSGLNPHRLGVRTVPGYGAAWKRRVRELNVAHASMNMQGALFASPEKFVDLDENRKDRFGLPLPRIHLRYEENDIAMADDMIQTCEEIIRISGGEVQYTPQKATRDNLQIDYNHWVGTVRMGVDPKTSVINADGQSHEIPNLFIGDASVFTTYPEKNPTLTNIALSWRMSEKLVEKCRRGEV
ncbi:MAG: GMC family oxidoreductase, partial [Acidobacteriaceae bacterium]|nr:GMC family oxidoreductase [Acidobacteriaceae bacterium]